MCPDPELNQRPFDLRDDVKPTEPHRAGLHHSSMLTSLHLPRARVHPSPPQVVQHPLSRPVHPSPRAGLCSLQPVSPGLTPTEPSHTLFRRSAIPGTLHLPFPQNHRSFFPGPGTYLKWCLVFSTHQSSFFLLQRFSAAHLEEVANS